MHNEGPLKKTCIFDFLFVRKTWHTSILSCCVPQNNPSALAAVAPAARPRRFEAGIWAEGDT